MLLVMFFMLASPVTAYAAGLDELATTGPQSTENTDEGLTNYLRSYNPITDENMAHASVIASPLVNVMGTVSGFIIMCTSAAIFTITALDLAYIGLPFLRSFLNPAQAAGNMGMAGGGMAGGYGRGAVSGGVQSAESGFSRRWVSDEAVYCAGLASQGQQVGGGMPGGMGMAGMQQPMPMKSVIFEYFKKRFFFLIIFAAATVILMSSLATDCGLNLAMLITKVLSKLSGSVSGINV